VVKILPPAGEGPSSETVRSLASSLADALQAEQFNVEVISDEQRTAREHLAQNPSTHHIITGLLVDKSSGAQVTVYTQGMASTKLLKADGIARLAGRVLEYLGSEEMLRLRLKMQDVFRDLSALEPDKKFAAQIQLGLYHLLDKKDLDEAIHAFEAAAETEKDSAVPHFNLALCYRLKGDVKRSW